LHPRDAAIWLVVRFVSRFCRTYCLASRANVATLLLSAAVEDARPASASINWINNDA